MKWINVNEKLPEHYQLCIAFGSSMGFPKEPLPSRYYSKYGGSFEDISDGGGDMGHCDLSNVTHWMELPKAPKL